MARVGRGRSRGGRILDISDLTVSSRGMGHGKVMTGRGVSSIEPKRSKEDLASPLHPDTWKEDDTKRVKEVKSLEQQLKDYVEAGEGSFIKITIDYFESNNDVQFYVDKVMECLLKSSQMVEHFAKSFRLITSLKTYGDEIKLKMFSKLQTSFQDMFILMEESSGLSEVERASVRNFAELLGQLFFRFRLQLNSLERYNVLAGPVIQCLNHLVVVRGLPEVILLIKLIVLNFTALSELHRDEMDQLSLAIRSSILDSSVDRVQRTWLLSGLDLISCQPSNLSQFCTDFYTDQLGQSWTEVFVSSPTQMLADIPSDIADTQMNKFTVTLEQYNSHKFVKI